MKSFYRNLSVAFVLVSGAALSAEMPKSDPFIPYNEIPSTELLPKGKGFSIAKDGSLLVDGKPRYLPAVLWYGDTQWGVNNAKENFGPLEWLYNRMPDYEAAQRLGVDAGGFYAPLNWMKRYYRPWTRGDVWAKPDPLYGITIGNGLSMYVDITASEWAHGSIWHADIPVNPDSKVKPEPCKKQGANGSICNHAECGAKLGAPGRLSSAAWTQGSQHWVPWSIVHPEGRSIWKHMWEGACIDSYNWAKAVGARPWCYELMNEPACWDESEYTKKAFAAAMKKKYGSIEKLNAAWTKSEFGTEKRYASFDEVAAAYGKNDNPTAFLVEYTKFMEKAFASLLTEGAKIVHTKVDSEALATFQPTTIRTRGIDLYTAYKNMDAVCSHTGGRGIMEAHMLRGLADGKPIVDSEMYIGCSENSIRNSYLDQFQRGYNISYAFKWNRLQKSSYNFLNLNNVQPEALRGIREAKLDALDVAELFAPRDRGVKREVAVLFSSSTERLSQCAGHQSYRLFDQAIVGLDFAQLLPDVIWEDQIVEDGATGRLGRYKVLVVAGVDAVRPGVNKAVKAWVERGGVLVLVGETMGLNEYGAANSESFVDIELGKRIESEVSEVTINNKKLQASAWREAQASATWKTLATIGDKPAFFEKNYGKGKVVFASAKMSGGSIGTLVASYGAAVNVTPSSLVTDALSSSTEPIQGIEISPAKRGDLEGWIISPRTMGGRVIRFKPASVAKPGDALIRVWNRPDPNIKEGYAPFVAFRQVIEPAADGSYVIDLTEGGTQIFVRGNLELLKKRFSGANSRWLAPMTADQAIAAGKERIEAENARREALKPAFTVNPDKIHQLDLRKVVNRRFVDKVARDGRDGWTDQGAQQSLMDTPWGITMCNGVPMDFIRYDQNGFRDCLVMKSTRIGEAPADEMPYPAKVEGIRVDQKAGNIYFLHAVAWGVMNRVETAFTYVINYGDGTKIELPVRNFHEVWDWGYIATTDDMTKSSCFKGWANGSNKGLYLWRWTNPHPEKQISSIDIVSACGSQIPLIAAISVEEPDTAVKVDGASHTLFSLGGSAGVKPFVTNGIWKVVLEENAGSWCCANADIRPGIRLDSAKPFKNLVFEVNRLPDVWGEYQDHATPQFRVNGRGADGKLRFGHWRVARYGDGSHFYRTDTDPETWQTVYISMDGFVGGDWTQIISFALQFQQMPTKHSGLEFRNIRFE